MGGGASVSSSLLDPSPAPRDQQHHFAQADESHNGPTMDGAVAFCGELWGSSPSGVPIKR